LGGVAEWGREHDRPIHLGEFGAYVSADMESRVRYTAAVVREAERMGWSWSYWQFDSDFIAFDMGAGLWVEPIPSALVPE
jgi:endoglucanase